MKKFLTQVKQLFLGGSSWLFDLMSAHKRPRFWSLVCMFVAGESFSLLMIRKELSDLFFLVLMFCLSLYWASKLKMKTDDKDETKDNQ